VLHIVDNRLKAHIRSVCVCVYLYMYTCVCIFIYIHIHTYTHTYIHTQHRYNESIDLTAIAEQELQSFTADSKRAYAVCINTTLAANGRNMTASLASCPKPDTIFAFNASGREGCMPDGMRGTRAMNCYTAKRTPPMTRRPHAEIACSRCAQWISETDTLRITAEQRIDAGSTVTFKFSREQMELFPPTYGVAADSPTVQVVHYNDMRDVPERQKYLSICSVRRVPSVEHTLLGCVRPNTASEFSSHMRVSVQTEAGTSDQSVVYGVQLSGFDAQVTALAPTQEPASPVLSLRIEPGVNWDKTVKVAVPMSLASLVSSIYICMYFFVFYICICMCVCVCVRVCVYIYIYIYIYIHTHTFVCVSVCVCLRVHVYVRLYLYMYVCMNTM
jgi:hypothetical protein